ncbi:MAG: succinylglutamate desuccinylase/aspartoacylase family protein [candidate division WS1 bacterium]|nr:succinylglutamate desuccinylase/aspartoacylase family protein [candidate division WS1 bacterium]
MQVGNLDVQPGVKTRGFVETEGWMEAIRVRIPILACCGNKPGPMLAVVAGQHGRELNGAEAVRRVFEELSPEKLAGTFIATPFANPLAVRLRYQAYPEEFRPSIPGINLNRTWPGKADGTPVERMAYALWHAVVKHADCVVDIHGWSHQSMGIVTVEKRHRELARVFGYALCLERNYEGLDGGGRLNLACYDEGIPQVIAELPLQNTLGEPGISMGVRGLRNLLVHLGMMEGELDLPSEQVWVNDESVEHELIAEVPGMLLPQLEPGAMLAEGDVIAVLVSLETLEVVQEVRSPVDGLLFNVGISRPGSPPESSVATGGERVAIVKEVMAG